MLRNPEPNYEEWHSHYSLGSHTESHHFTLHLGMCWLKEGVTNVFSVFYRSKIQTVYIVTHNSARTYKLSIPYDECTIWEDRIQLGRLWNIWTAPGALMGATQFTDFVGFSRYSRNMKQLNNLYFILPIHIHEELSVLNWCVGLLWSFNREGKKKFPRRNVVTRVAGNMGFAGECSWPGCSVVTVNCDCD